MIMHITLSEDEARCHSRMQDHIATTMFALVGYLESLENNPLIPGMLKRKLSTELVESIEEILEDCKNTYVKK